MSENSPFLLAVDVGTSSLKAAVYSRSGEVLSSAGHRYGYQTPHPGWAVADPAAWWQALLITLKQLQDNGADLTSVPSVALTGQMHTAVLLDKDQIPLEPSLPDNAP